MTYLLAFALIMLLLHNWHLSRHNRRLRDTMALWERTFRDAANIVDWANFGKVPEGRWLDDV